jgi:hypothetical protein
MNYSYYIISNLHWWKCDKCHFVFWEFGHVHRHINTPILCPECEDYFHGRILYMNYELLPTKINGLFSRDVWGWYRTYVDHIKIVSPDGHIEGKGQIVHYNSRYGFVVPESIQICKNNYRDLMPLNHPFHDFFQGISSKENNESLLP